MSKAKWLLFINPLLLLLLLAQGITGFTRDHMPESAFKITHIGGGCVLIALGVIHLLLNWNWVRANYFKRAAGKHAKTPEENVQ